MDEAIRRAIRERRMLAFAYGGYPRVAEPHVYGVKGGRRGMLGYQTGGASSTGAFGWKRFHLDKIRRMAVAGERFGGPRPNPSGEHSKWDGLFAVVGRDQA